MPQVTPVRANASEGSPVQGEGVRAREASALPGWDAYIACAPEDHGEVGRPLAERLLGHGLTVWFADFQLTIGDRRRATVDVGLRHCRFGVPVLSRHFFAESDSQYDLDGFISREMNGEQLILPVLHRLTKAELIELSPSLADRVARSTTLYTLDQIAAEIALKVTTTSAQSD